MDERHWWFASKLQETFHFGGYDNPTLLEDFLSESDVGELINRFLSPGEPCKLFFYCNATPPSSVCSPTALSTPNESCSSPGPSRMLHVASRLARDVLAQGCVCLYVLRKSIEEEVDSSMMEKELFCGEIRHSVLSSLAMLLTEAYLPILYSKIDWGQCSEDTVANFLQNFTKFSGLLSGVATDIQKKRLILQRPSKLLMEELIHGHDTQHRGVVGGNGGGGAVGGGFGGGPEIVLKEIDSLIIDWSGSIESLMIDVTDERYKIILLAIIILSVFVCTLAM